jgi:Holliday junction resolvase RusA-like endonuclease
MDKTRRSEMALGEVMELAFFVGMPDDIPAPSAGGSKKLVTNRRTGQTMIVDDAKYNAAWKKHVAQVARLAVWSILKEPLKGVLYAQFCFRMPRPKHHFFKDGTLKPTAPVYHTFRPDTTKLVRATEDACTGILYTDDSIIAMQLAEKKYSDRPGVEIYVSDWMPTEIRITP